MLFRHHLTDREPFVPERNGKDVPWLDPFSSHLFFTEVAAADTPAGGCISRIAHRMNLVLQFSGPATRTNPILFRQIERPFPVGLHLLEHVELKRHAEPP